MPALRVDLHGERLNAMPVARWGIMALGAAACCLLIGCRPAPPPEAAIEPPAIVLPAGYQELPPDEAERWIEETPGIVLIDVRTETEVAEEGRLPASQLFDYLHGDAMFERLGKLPRDRPILVYCAIGGRAKLAAARMHGMGFEKVAILKGGLNAWIASGRTVVK